MNQLKRVALVTGAARRVGAVIAKYLHQHGFHVLVHAYRSYSEACALVDELNQDKRGHACALSADLCDKQAILELVQQTVIWAGRIDLVVNNASFFSRHEADWDTLFHTNVRAPFWLSHAALPHLMKTRGTIINITDTHADKPLADYEIYSQTKAALAMQTKALAFAFAPGVRVNAVAPGAMIWPESDNAVSTAIQEEIIQKTWLKQHGDPIYIAQAVLSLADNPFITGQTLCVDGGRR